MPDETKISSSESWKFATTHWSVILAAGDSSSPQHEQALSELCQSYWYPLYAYLRRCGYDTQQAEDYTQAFFAQMLEKHYLYKVEPKPGKFRSFLLVALKRFVSDQHARAKAAKRGGDHKMLPIDIKTAENQYIQEPISNLTPEKLFEKFWALTILERAMSRLEDELAGINKHELFNNLKIYLAGEKSHIPYNDMAGRLNMTEEAVKMAVYRLRRQYREILRDEIAQTVASEEQIDGEIQDLFAALTD
jgi:RNA polymerase sigma factor (sigma-70 family)